MVESLYLQSNIPPFPDISTLLWQVYCVPTDLNPADLLTRGTAKLRDIGTNSFHQKGPKFLSFPRAAWPVTREFVREEVPDEMICKGNKFAAAKFVSKELQIIHDAVDKVLDYSDSLNKVIRILARVLRGWKNYVPDSENNLEITNPSALTLIANEPTVDELAKARKLLLIHAMSAPRKAELSILGQAIS